LGGLNRPLLGKLYASEGRSSIAPEQAERVAASIVVRHPVGTPADGGIGADDRRSRHMNELWMDDLKIVFDSVLCV
jgi:hypothetical protein